MFDIITTSAAWVSHHMALLPVWGQLALVIAGLVLVPMAASLGSGLLGVIADGPVWFRSDAEVSSEVRRYRRAAYHRSLRLAQAGLLVAAIVNLTLYLAH